MQRAWSALLGAALAGGPKAEQLQYGSHGNRGVSSGEVDGRTSRFSGKTGLLVLGLSNLFAAFASLVEFAVAFGKDFLVTAFEFVLGGDVTDGAVQADVVVMGDVVRDDPPPSSREEGTWTRMHSLLMDLCQRSILPLDWG